MIAVRVVRRLLMIYSICSIVRLSRIVSLMMSLKLCACLDRNYPSLSALVSLMLLGGLFLPLWVYPPLDPLLLIVALLSSLLHITAGALARLIISIANLLGFPPPFSFVFVRACALWVPFDVHGGV